MNSKTFIQFVKFVMFSISAGVIQAGSFTLFNELFHFRYWPAYLITLILSVVWNFTFNRKYTFKSAVNVPVAMAKLFGFYAVFTPVSTIIGHLADENDVNEYLILVITMICNFVLEFLFCKFVVFRNPKTDNISNKI